VQAAGAVEEEERLAGATLGDLGLEHTIADGDDACFH